MFDHLIYSKEHPKGCKESCVSCVLSPVSIFVKVGEVGGKLISSSSQRLQSRQPEGCMEDVHVCQGTYTGTYISGAVRSRSKAGLLRKDSRTQIWWYMPSIPAPWEAKTGKLQVRPHSE